MNYIAYIITAAETLGWHPIIPAIIIAFPVVFGFTAFLFWLAEKDKKQ